MLLLLLLLLLLFQEKLIRYGMTYESTPAKNTYFNQDN